ncbi:MAG: hypothetical protein V1645_04755 [archaeon]
MTDSKTLDDAFKTREDLQKQLWEADLEIRKAAVPLILGVLESYNDKDFWPGRTAQDITMKIHTLYDKRFTEYDVTTALENLNHEGTVIRTNMGQRTGYKLK